MRAIGLSTKYRSVIAIGAAIGVCQALFQAFTRNLGPVVGLVAAVTTTAALALVVSLALECASRDQEEQQQT